MRAALLALALAACTYDPRGVLNHEDDAGNLDVDAATLPAPDANPSDAAPAAPPDATLAPPDATPAPPDAGDSGGCDPACTGLDVCCADGTCALLGLCS